jgi:hypothetical protein
VFRVALEQLVCPLSVTSIRTTLTCDKHPRKAAPKAVIHHQFHAATYAVSTYRTEFSAPGCLQRAQIIQKVTHSAWRRRRALRKPLEVGPVAQSIARGAGLQTRDSQRLSSARSSANDTQSARLAVATASTSGCTAGLCYEVGPRLRWRTPLCLSSGPSSRAGLHAGSSAAGAVCAPWQALCRRPPAGLALDRHGGCRSPILELALGAAQ